MAKPTSAGAGVLSTVTPADQQASRIAALCQCGGSSTTAASPGATPTPSTSRFAVLATQLASVAPDSSVRSPFPSSYQVNSGRVGSTATMAAKRAPTVVMSQIYHNDGAVVSGGSHEDLSLSVPVTERSEMAAGERRLNGGQPSVPFGRSLN